MQTPDLTLFAYPGLLIIYWQRGQRLKTEVEIVLDGDVLSRPLLGIELAGDFTYIIAAYSPEVETLEKGALKIMNADRSILGEVSFDQKLTQIPLSLLSTWSPVDRVRVERGLLFQSGRYFPSLASDTIRRIAKSLAEKNVFCLAGPGGRCYVRMPWLTVEVPSLLDANIRCLRERQSDADQFSVKALVVGGFLHLILDRTLSAGKGQNIYIFDAGQIRCLPFEVSKIVGWDSARSLSEWYSTLVESAGPHEKVLRGYVASTMNVSVTDHVDNMRASESKLQGRVTGIRAGRLSGWALNPARPGQAVRLNVIVDNRFQNEVIADRPIKLAKNGQPGRHAFSWELPKELLSGDRHKLEVVGVSDGPELSGSPIFLGKGEYDSEIRIDEFGTLVGWVQERTCTPTGTPKLQITIDDQPYEATQGNTKTSRLVRTELNEKTGQYRFAVDLPDLVFDTDEHAIRMNVTQGGCLVGQGLGHVLKVKAVYRGYLDIMSPDQVAGWVMNDVAPKRKTFIEVLMNDRVVANGFTHISRPDVRGQLTDFVGFDIRISEKNSSTASSCIELRLRGGKKKIFSTSTLFIPYDLVIQTLASISSFINDSRNLNLLPGAGPVDKACLLWFRRQVLVPLQSKLREDKTISGPVSLPLQQTLHLPDRIIREAEVDVIIPVYGGGDIVLRCLTSVLCSHNQQLMELVVIDDGAPDPALSLKLDNLARIHGFTLLKNVANIGFVGTVNRGMRLHPGRDVVLLNSDTVVADGWLDRLRAAAYSVENIGTVTPMSNNATICSFPVFCSINRLPKGKTVADLDGIFSKANSGLTVDLPTAVGFCMYIKRDVLEDVGYFDKGQWGRGYAEENDFCLKASSQGWRNVAACDVFVEHEGGVSFGESGGSQLRKNLETLNTIYPDYARTVQRFIEADPLASARSNASKHLIKEFSSAYMLHVIHGLGGGAKKSADDLAACLSSQGTAVLELMSVSLDQWVLKCTELPYAVHYRFTDLDLLVEDLKAFGVWHIHYHQTMHYPKEIWSLPSKLGVQYDFTVHDYLPVCPRINMIDESGQYCGESQHDSLNCFRCVSINGLEHDLQDKYQAFGGTVAGWRKIYSEVLARARQVVAPSQTVADIMLRHFALENLKVMPHPEPGYSFEPVARNSKSYSVCVIGAIGPHKGYERLLNCAKSAEKEGLPLSFHIVGFTTSDEQLLKFKCVTISGQYEHDALSSLIQATGADVALFLSPWPETYSYTLSETWRHGLYPVALDIGAIAERIRENGCGHLIPVDADAKAVNRHLMDVLNKADYRVSSFTRPGNNDNVLNTYYGLAAPG